MKRNFEKGNDGDDMVEIGRQNIGSFVPIRDKYGNKDLPLWKNGCNFLVCNYIVRTSKKNNI